MANKCPKCDTENPSDFKYCKECATPLLSSKEIPVIETLETPTAELTRGTTFAGRYEIIEELGKGGMGKIYRVEDKKIKEEVALKLIKPEIASDKKTIKRFSNELKMSRKIAHRNVCRMFDLGEEKGVNYITMEYVVGEDLKGMIGMMGQLSAGKAISVAKQVCEGLAEAHRLGVVHRDLKPQNIMIDREGNARIMDFGIARSLKAEGLTGVGVMIGTPEYVSPEQAEGKETDQRSDIYSLGVVLYEMVTRRIPFKGKTPLSIALKHKTEPPQDPKEFNAQIPEDLSRVILKCMEKDKKRRYQTAEELLSELNKIEEGFTTTERVLPQRKPLTERIVKFGWKKSVLYFAGFVVLLVLVIMGAISLFTDRQEAIYSIAVLPLENISGDPEQEYFADGMTEALIAELTKISALQRVISRTSVMQYKQTRKSMSEITQELNVDVVVEGSVLLIGERVRVTAQLIDAEADRHLWADSYERDISNILALQRELARTIAQEIKIVITPEEETHLKESPTVNPEAYSLYLKGRFFWNKRTREGLRKAVEYFEAAIRKDPDYALAYAGIADAYISMGDYYILNPKEAYLKAKEAAMKALEIDDTLAEAYTSLAYIKHYLDLDWPGVEEGFKRAISINPNYSTAHQWYSNILANLGRLDEARAEIKRAQELDPLSPPIITGIGANFYLARNYNRAIEQCKRALEVNPNFAWAHSVLGDAYIQQSLYEEAISEKQLALDLSGGSPEYLAELAYAYGFSGKKEEAQKILLELQERKKEEYVPVCEVVFTYISIGEREEALKALELAVERMELSWELLNIKVDPLFDSLRSESRFVDLLMKLGLEK